jgi:molybdenum cofactor biosynthesis protein B
MRPPTTVGARTNANYNTGRRPDRDAEAPRDAGRSASSRSGRLPPGEIFGEVRCAGCWRGAPAPAPASNSHRHRHQCIEIRDNFQVSHIDHKALAPVSVTCYVLTVSDTRTRDTDTSGRAIRELLEGAGHTVSGSAIVGDDPEQVTSAVREQLRNARTQVVITTGGTGVSSRDGTFDAVDRLLEKRLDGLGELFRMLSFDEIGAAAMMSRATAGTVGRQAIFVLPGSEKAVRLAMTRLILPELGHVMQQLKG